MLHLLIHWKILNGFKFLFKDALPVSLRSEVFTSYILIKLKQ